MDFIDLKSQYHAYQSELDSAIADVLHSCAFVQGPQVTQLEAMLSMYTGAPHAIACSSGTDALLLPLMALGIQAGDEVIVPDFTFFATAEVISFLGATPIFADIDPITWSIDPQDVARKISPRTKGIIAVSLYGQCADMVTLNQLAKDHGIWLIEDAAQSFGATQHGMRSCNLSSIATTSFFPAKPLGCYGNGGAVFTSDPNLATKLRSLLNHGQEGRYNHTAIGFNGRLDTIQAAILLVKLRHYQTELDAREAVAQRYIHNLSGIVQLPTLSTGNSSVWAQFTVMHPKRDIICKVLESQGIPTSIHYPIPLHKQPVFASLGVTDDSCPVAVNTAKQVFSLPMHAFMTNDQIDQISDAIRKVI